MDAIAQYTLARIGKLLAIGWAQSFDLMAGESFKQGGQLSSEAHARHSHWLKKKWPVSDAGNSPTGQHARLLGESRTQRAILVSRR